MKKKAYQAFDGVQTYKNEWSLSIIHYIQYNFFPFQITENLLEAIFANVFLESVNGEFC